MVKEDIGNRSAGFVISIEIRQIVILEKRQVLLLDLNDLLDQFLPAEGDLEI